MARLLHRLGVFTNRHRLATILSWLVLFIVLGVTTATLSGKTVSTFSIPGQESTTAFDVLGERFGAAASAAQAQVVVQAPAGQSITDPANAQRVVALVDALGKADGVVNATNPLAPEQPTVSPDLTTAFSTVSYGVVATELTETQREALAEAVQSGRDAGLVVERGGEATEQTEVGGGAAEAIGVIIAMLVLLVTYGSLAAAGMNLITALVGVGIGVLGVTTLTGFIELQSTTPILATMLGLAVGIDYALFIVTRFRQELHEGHAVPEAVALAVGTAGSAVLTAGLTVVIALAGLAVAGVPFLTEMGLAAAATVIIAVLIAITLVPAVLSYIGLRALPKKARTNLGGSAHERGIYRVWANGVVKGRWIALLLTIGILGTMSIPLFSMQTTLTTPAADGSTQARAAELITTKFGKGVNGPLIVLVDGVGAAGRSRSIASDAMKLDGVAFASVQQVNDLGNAAIVSVVPTSGPTDKATTDLVHQLRAQIKAGTGPPAYVTGVTAISVDVSQKLGEALPIYLTLVVGLALLLLILVFRSILVPLVGVLGFLLTIGTALGATVAVFQWGWLSDIVQPASIGPLQSLAPIILVGILFGLAMDYQVFLVSRIHEAYAHGASPHDAIRSGFRKAAPVVVAAAAIMLAVFASFVTESNPIIKSIGFALALGILCDAIVVRMVLMPAAIAIMGRAAWWFPSWLEWLPQLDVEGEALQRQREVKA